MITHPALTRMPRNWVPANLDHAHDVGFLMGQPAFQWWPESMKWAWNLGALLKEHMENNNG